MVASVFAPREVPFRALWPFLILAFGLTWGLAGLLIAFPEAMAARFGDLTITNPIFILAVYAPGIAALLTVGFFGGLRGLGGYLGRWTLWRCPSGWYLLLFLGIPAIYTAGAALKGNLFTGPLPFESFGALLLAILTMAMIGPIEEFGWRGVVLPLLQRRVAPIQAGLILGGIWGLWHLPAFYLSGAPQEGWSFPAFFLGAVAVSVIVTPLFNASRGSILLPAAFHWQLNNPLWPDAQPWDTPFFVLAAVLVVWVCRDSLFTRDAAATEVIPGAAAAA